MKDTTDIDEPAGTEKRNWLKMAGFPILMVSLVVAVFAVAFYFYQKYPEEVAELTEQLKNYGYLGAFLISLIGNATILFPVAVLPILVAISVLLYPVTGPIGPITVGLVGGAGAAIGEISSYIVGYSGRGVAMKSKMYLRLVGWMKRWGVLAVFINASLPFYFDLMGIAAGALRFPLWKFVLACWLGRTLNYVIFVTLVSAWGWEAVLRFFG